MISFLGLFSFIVAAILLSTGILYFNPILALLAPFMIFLGGLLDVLDGEVARRTNNASPKGAFLDSNLDRVSDCVMVLGLILGGLVTYLVGYILLFMILMISYMRSRAENEGVEMMGIGFMERGERVILLFIALIAEAWMYAVVWNVTHEEWVVHLEFLTAIPVTPIFIGFIFLYAALLFITIIQRLAHTFKSLNDV